MITQRLRGLVNLHAVAMTGVALLLFLGYANVAASGWLKPYLDLSTDVRLTPYVLCVFGGMLLSWRHLLLFASRFHDLTWVDAARITTRQASLVALFIFTLMFAVKDRGTSRLFLGTYLCLFWMIGLFLNHGLPRFLSQMLFQRQHRAPTLFVGDSAQADRLREWLASKEVLGIHPVGVLTLEGGALSGGTALPFLGALPDLARVIDEKEVAQVIMLSLPTSREEGRNLIETCQERGCRLLIRSNLSELLDHPLVLVREDRHTFYSLQEEPLEDPLNRLQKRAFDIAVSLPVVVLILPPLAVWVWLMQRVQAPGPLLFVQERAGQRGKRFSLLKFRSMYRAERDNAEEAVQARQGDKRIYPFGQFIRRTSLDEFPQFANVLFGSMSIVGPRPHMPEHDNRFSQYYRGYRTRHFAKPGITGLAQTRGFRGEITDPTLLQQRIENDLLYISSWSIWLDVLITLKTVRQVVFPPKTAY